AVQHRQTLLLDPLHRHERHARPRHRLADRRSINWIRLAALDKGLDVVRRHQLYGVPEFANLTSPIMRTPARFHADETRWQLGEERQHLLASEPPGDDDIAGDIDAVDVEYLLCLGYQSRRCPDPFRMTSVWRRMFDAQIVPNRV